MIKVIPLGFAIGATVEEVNLQQVPNPETVTQIENALEKYGVLIFPNQKISPQQQVAFSAAFGPLEMTELEQARLDEVKEIFVVGNVGKGLVSFAPSDPGDELEWHTDHIHHKVAARASMLYAKEVPDEGGDTLFACMYHAYDTLNDQQKTDYDRLETINSASGLEHFLEKQNLQGSLGSMSGRKHDQVVRPLVRAHPLTGRKALYFGNQITIGIVGWGQQEAEEFIGRLTGHATQSAFQYRHQWTPGDAVLWDNRRVLHAGLPYDVVNTRRLMHRTTLRETLPIKLVETH